MTDMLRRAPGLTRYGAVLAVMSTLVSSMPTLWPTSIAQPCSKVSDPAFSATRVVAPAAARLANARTEFNRFQQLVASGVVSQREFDSIRTIYMAAQEELASARELLEKGATGRAEDIAAREAEVRGLEARESSATRSSCRFPLFSRTPPARLWRGSSATTRSSNGAR